MKVLDTDHCVALLRRVLPLNRLSTVDTVAVTSITVAELSHGAHRSAQPERNLLAIEILLSSFFVLPFDEPSARVFGLIKADLQRSSLLIEDLDLQIASVCLRHQATLVTHNTRHYQRVPQLVFEDWL
jgi:tRNA(fMet)-specific endonuclease VapC